MTPQPNNIKNDGISFSRWITARIQNWKKPLIMVSAAVFIWMLFVGYQQSKLQVQRIEQKLRKHSGGIAKLASLTTTVKFSTDENTDCLLAISTDTKLPDDINPEAEIELLSTPSSESCKPETTAVTKPEPSTKKKDVDTAAATENKALGTTSTANRKPVRTASKGKNRTGAQQHFGVGLKLSI